MRATEHDLNSLRSIIRDLQNENQRLIKLLDDNHIPYEHEEIIEKESVPEEYDEDQGTRILSMDLNEKTANEFYSYFWGRMDVFAKRGKNGGYFPQCEARWNNPECPKRKDEKRFCDEDCPFRAWKPLESWMIPRSMGQTVVGKKTDKGGSGSLSSGLELRTDVDESNNELCKRKWADTSMEKK